jgi:uncharacterized protein YifE (UPF0438 family)
VKPILSCNDLYNLITNVYIIFDSVLLLLDPLGKECLNSDDQQFHQYQQNKQSPLNTDDQQFHQYQQNKQSPLNSDGQQFHQYQQNKQSPLNSDGQQYHQYQQKKQSPLNSDGQQFHQYQQNKQSPLNSDGQQFYQYQQNEQLSLISIIKHKKNMTHGIGNPGLGLGQTKNNELFVLSLLDVASENFTCQSGFIYVICTITLNDAILFLLILCVCQYMFLLHCM